MNFYKDKYYCPFTKGRENDNEVAICIDLLEKGQRTRQRYKYGLFKFI